MQTQPKSEIDYQKGRLVEKVDHDTPRPLEPSYLSGSI